MVAKTISPKYQLNARIKYTIATIMSIITGMILNSI